MKKSLFNKLAGMILLLCSAGSARSQYEIASSQAVVGVESNQAPKTSIVSMLPDQEIQNEVNIKALRDFYKKHPQVADEKWVRFKDGSVVFFVADGIHHRVYYDLKGAYQCTIRLFTEDQLSPDLRHHIKSTYYDYNIIIVNEISSKGLVVYQAKLENKHRLLNIQIRNDEISVLEDYRKN